MQPSSSSPPQDDTTELKPYQRRNVIRGAFPPDKCHTFVVGCCANDTVGMTRAQIIAHYEKEYLPLHDDLVQQRLALVSEISNEERPPLLPPVVDATAPPKEKKKKERCRLQGMGGGAGGSGSKKKANPTTDAPTPVTANAVSVASGAGFVREMSSMTGPQVNVLRPGLVFIKHAMSRDVQQHFTTAAERLGAMMFGPDRSCGWWCRRANATSEPELNNGDFGQMQENIASFPPQFDELCQTFLGVARGNDATLPEMHPTYVLLNYYLPTSGGMYWHRDNSKGELESARRGIPVVSFSVGDACVFSYRQEQSDPIQEVLLESGDVLVFGGPSRLILHSVTKVYGGSAPKWLRREVPGGRINMTFRQVL
eukprot:PhM_4_TR4519/c0_g1_i2/m.58688